MPSRPASTRALYLQVWDALAKRISSGARKTGSAIPNESDLAHEFGLSAESVTKGPANEQECTRLRLRANEAVYRNHRVLDHRGQIFLIEDSTLPASLFPGLADRTAIADAIGVLAQEYGISLGKVEERISMRVPPAAIAKALLIPSGTPVMVFDRVVLMIDGHRPVEWRLVHCHPAGAYFR